MRGPSKTNSPKVVVITPDDAMGLLESNQQNRPLDHQHVMRLARQMTDGKWKFNGDTIKISVGRDILDGQHRLWACVESKIEIETIVVYDIEPDAFSTIDTLRKTRSGADILSLMGADRHRKATATALSWLIRWQRKVLDSYKEPKNRIENSDIEDAYRNNPSIVRAAERTAKLRSIYNTGVLAFFYYVLTNRNSELAERMVSTLENPAGVSINDPFYRLRLHMMSEKRKDAVHTIALMVKAANAASENRELKMLLWRNQGTLAEPFPKLEVVTSNKDVR